MCVCMCVYFIINLSYIALEPYHYSLYRKEQDQYISHLIDRYAIELVISDNSSCI